MRLLASWWVDAGPISIYHASRALLALKTWVFIDFVVERFQREGFSERFAGSLVREAGIAVKRKTATQDIVLGST